MAQSIIIRIIATDMATPLHWMEKSPALYLRTMPA